MLRISASRTSTSSIRPTWIFTLAIALSFTVGCSSMMRKNAPSKTEAQRDSEVPSKSQATAPNTTHYTVVSFEQGHADLSPNERMKLRRLADAAKKFGKVEEIRVLAWADNDDPTETLQKESIQSKIAKDRASEIRKYLKQEIKTSAEIEVYNMATKPSAFNQLIKGDDLESKTTFENTGNAPLDNGPKSSLAGSKASKAIVLIRYENKETL